MSLLLADEKQNEALEKDISLISKSHRQIRNNQWILFVAMITFALFVVAELIGALVSHSLSLLGDASAMALDVVTVRPAIFDIIRRYIN